MVHLEELRRRPRGGEGMISWISEWWRRRWWRRWWRQRRWWRRWRHRRRYHRWRRWWRNRGFGQSLRPHLCINGRHQRGDSWWRWRRLGQHRLRLTVNGRRRWGPTNAGEPSASTPPWAVGGIHSICPWSEMSEPPPSRHFLFECVGGHCGTFSVLTPTAVADTLCDTTFILSSSMRTPG